MPPVKTTAGKEYWRSLDDLAETPELREFVSKEFPNFSHDSISETTRRSFLKLMGASLALAGLTSCRWPEEKIAPFAHRPEGLKPGIPQHFATARELDGVGTGLVVTSYDGRPIKVEGNELHPFSLGAADFHAQAALLEMYDPERSRFPVHRSGGQMVVKTWDDFDAFAAEQFAALRKSGGAELAILGESTASPSVEALRKRIEETMPSAQWFEYEPISRDNERAGTALAFGRPLRPRIDLAKASVVVCLDADPLMTHPAALRQARDFTARRNPDAEDGMTRLYVFEPSFSVTGTMADHRYAMAAAAIPSLTAHLAAALKQEAKGEVAAKMARIAELDRLSASPESLSNLPAIARDLLHHAGRCVILAGPRQPAEVHALVAWMNEALGNAGTTVRYAPEPEAERPSHADAIRTLAAEMKNGKVSTLLILGGNPVLTAPADVEFESAMGLVETSLHLSLYDDETSRACEWHVPRAHFLESWGDTRAWDGSYSVVQPLIAPLYDGRTLIGILEALAGEKPASDYDVVRRTFKNLHGERASDSGWEKALQDGLLDGSATPEAAGATVRAEPVAGFVQPLAAEVPAPSKDALEVLFVRDLKLLDGRFANNGWLQELADPISKLTWDNAAYLGPKTAAALGVDQGDVVSVSVNGRDAQLPVYILPGQAAWTVTLPLGYGRTAAGRVGNEVGVNVYPLRTSATMDVAAGAKIEPIGRKHALATTQDHHTIDILGLEERTQRSMTLVRSVDREEFEKAPEESVEHLGMHYPKGTQLFRSPPLKGHRWAMAIDLNTCIGCSACVTACQAENNTPIVGREQVLTNREMHWIRVDRYFQGDPDSPKAVHNPLMCVHCENAPCEQVCPVAATVHTDEGLNMMVYNRCIGTRYCSNNCPYKVRRFNFFNYHKNVAEVQKLMYNPEVTIRARGVMEKCSYCLQRIEAVKIQAKNERRAIRDGEIRTACQQTCPTQAIVFGDLADPKSRVSRLHKDPRAYGMLAELLILPRTKYLARLRNPNPELHEASAEEEPSHHA